MAELEAALGAAVESDDDGLWPENEAIVEAFLSCDTQWRVAAVGRGLAPGRLFFAGLDYAGARAGIEAAGIVLTPELWRGVRIMEGEARDALNGIDG